jgi:UV DNA damage endonuclease
MRLGLCCAFVGEDIAFRATTARFVAQKAERAEQLFFLAELALDNARALGRAVTWCAAHDVGAFRVPSQLLALATHPEVGYAPRELPLWRGVERALRAVRDEALRGGVRLSVHPDQFVVPGSASERVVASSLAELEHQAELAAILGAEQLTIHGGGAQPDKPAALARLTPALERLSPRARALIALENDERVYTVEDLLPVCRAAELPLVYDVRHHRCNPDRLDVEGATDRAAARWATCPAAGSGGG